MSALLEKLLRVAEVEAATGLDRSTIYRLIKDDAGFPEPIQLTARSVAWRASEVAAWIEARAAKGREEWRANRPQARAQAQKRRAAAVQTSAQEGSHD